MKGTGSWLFFCNTKIYPIDDFLNSGEIELTWETHESQKVLFNIGDQGVIRVSLDKRTRAELNGKQKLVSGVYAIVQIISIPDYQLDSDLGRWPNQEKSKGIRLRVWLKVLKNLIGSPISIKELHNIVETNKDGALIKGRRLNSFPLSRLAFNKIDEISDLRLAEIENG